MSNSEHGRMSDQLVVGRLRGSELALLLFLCLLVWLAYYPGLSGPFLFDDFEKITRNAQIAISDLSANSLSGAAFSRSIGIFGRQLAMLTFALNYYFAGGLFDSFVFKATNLAIHTANVVLVFFLVRQLLPCWESSEIGFRLAGGRRDIIIVAACSAALWGLHPIQLTSVLYIVQRMTSLSAFFVLFGLLVFIHGRKRLHNTRVSGLTFMTAGLAGGAALGFLCKESALLLPFLIFVVELVFFTRTNLDASSRRSLAAFYLFFIALPVIAVSIYLVVNPGFIEGTYATRDFGMWERLLTQSRVLFFYLSLFLFPLLSRYSLFHEFTVSTGIMDPVFTLISLILWAVLTVLTVYGLRRRAIWAFGLAWFLVGHLMESTIIGLELAHEHRNYVPTVGLAVVAVFYALIFFRWLSGNLRLGSIVCACTLAALCFVTFVRASTWSSRPLLFQMMARNHPNSYRAQIGWAQGMAERGMDLGAVYNKYRDVGLVNPRTVRALIEMTKIVHALVVADPLNEGNPADLHGRAHESVDWNSDLKLDRRYLQQLELALRMEIERRLRAGPTHIETVKTLTTLQECLYKHRPYCLPSLDQILEWHFLALNALPSGARGQDLLELSIAKLFALKSDQKRSLEYFDRAIASSSFAPAMKIRKALFLISIDRREEAKAIADEVQADLDGRQQFSVDMKILRRALEK